MPPNIGYVTWGTFCWLLPGAGSHLLYEADDRDIRMFIHGDSCALEDAGSLPLTALLEERTRRCIVIFSIVDSNTGRRIWCARCRLVFPTGAFHLSAYSWGDLESDYRYLEGRGGLPSDSFFEGKRRGSTS